VSQSHSDALVVLLAAYWRSCLQEDFPGTHCRPMKATARTTLRFPVIGVGRKGGGTSISYKARRSNSLDSMGGLDAAGVGLNKRS